MYRFAHGRREGRDDAAIVDELSGRFASSNYDFTALMIDLVSDESFGFRRQEEAE